MAIKSQAARNEIYRLKVTLDGMAPPIWRRIEVAGTTTLEELHFIIQDVMGWTNSHLHDFAIGRNHISEPADGPGFDFSPPRNSGEDVAVSQLGLRVKGKLTYTYDFGDSWTHTVLVEAIEHREPKVNYPRCTAGRRACPPEDCGGIWGYANMLEALADAKHPSHENMVEWIGTDFDAEAFDLEQVNKMIGTSG